MKVHVKIADRSYFLYETTTGTTVTDLLSGMLFIYNGQLILQSLCLELIELCKYGIIKADVESLVTQAKTDEYRCKDGCIENTDPSGNRTGQAPNESMADVIKRTVAEAQSAISEENVVAGICLTNDKIRDITEMLSGAVSIVYPLGLPHYEPVQQLLNAIQHMNETTEPTVNDALRTGSTELWWAGKQLVREKKLKDYVGNNEKTKIVVKLQKSGGGPPRREPTLSEEQRKQLMLHNYKRQEELKSLEDDSELNYLDSEWADRQSLHRNLNGVENISWKPH